MKGPDLCPLCQWSGPSAVALESSPLAHRLAVRVELLSELTKTCAPQEILIYKGDVGFLLH